MPQSAGMEELTGALGSRSKHVALCAAAGMLVFGAAGFWLEHGPQAIHLQGLKELRVALRNLPQWITGSAAARVTKIPDAATKSPTYRVELVDAFGKPIKGFYEHLMLNFSVTGHPEQMAISFHPFTTLNGTPHWAGQGSFTIIHADEMEALTSLPSTNGARTTTVSLPLGLEPPTEAFQYVAVSIDTAGPSVIPLNGTAFTGYARQHIVSQETADAISSLAPRLATAPTHGVLPLAFSGVGLLVGIGAGLATSRRSEPDQPGFASGPAPQRDRAVELAQFFVRNAKDPKAVVVLSSAEAHILAPILTLWQGTKFARRIERIPPSTSTDGLDPNFIASVQRNAQRRSLPVHIYGGPREKIVAFSGSSVVRSEQTHDTLTSMLIDLGVDENLIRAPAFVSGDQDSNAKDPVTALMEAAGLLAEIPAGTGLEEKFAFSKRGRKSVAHLIISPTALPAIGIAAHMHARLQSTFTVIANDPSHKSAIERYVIDHGWDPLLNDVDWRSWVVVQNPEIPSTENRFISAVQLARGQAQKALLIRSAIDPTVRNIMVVTVPLTDSVSLMTRFLQELAQNTGVAIRNLPSLAGRFIEWRHASQSGLEQMA